MGGCERGIIFHGMKSMNFWFRPLIYVILFLFATMLTACYPAGAPERVNVRVERGERVYEGSLEPGISVRDALERLGVGYEPEDRVTPGLNRSVFDDETIQIAVITSEETSETEILPFESQLVRNETIPEGETYLLQSGENGMARVTRRKVYADSVFESESIVSREILAQPVPEILMVGVQGDMAPIRIPGKLIYISNGNAWMMSETTGSRTPLYTGGDLDGRILDLSDNGKWLLFSRKGQGTAINSLWMLNVENWTEPPISLRIENTVHFAQWLPGEILRVAYSTVEPSETAPGWVARNDLLVRTVSDTGMLMGEATVVEANERGANAWWGMHYLVSSDGRTLLAVGSDRVESVDRLSGETTELIRIFPYGKARSDWAWIPGVAWSDELKRIYFTYQGEISGTRRTLDPADFNLGMFDETTGASTPIRLKTGLFTEPVLSPKFGDGSRTLAYLTAVNPLQSDTGRYRIAIADADGANARVVYPLDGGTAIDPQRVVWAPVVEKEQSWLGFLMDGNIWLVNPFTGIYNQITIDRTIEKIIWE